MSSITIQIPEYLKKRVEKLTTEGGFSIDQFFATAASEKIAVIEEHGYINECAAQASDTAFDDAISQIPATPVTEEWDQMPEK